MEFDKIEQIVNTLKDAEAIVIGAGAGLSTAAGLTYSAGFYPFETQEEKWAYWSKHIDCNRYEPGALSIYEDLIDLVKGHSYFVLTTNVDHQFQKAGVPKERLFATQGDYGLFQCAKACHKKLYSNEQVIKQMLAKQKDCKIPSYLIPKCPVCGGDIAVNLRCDEYFIEDSDWEEASERYEAFLDENKHKKIVFLELGVGMNTPGIIKYPFWQMTHQFEDARYICINKGEAWAPTEIINKSICMDADIKDVIYAINEILIKREA